MLHYLITKRREVAPRYYITRRGLCTCRLPNCHEHLFFSSTMTMTLDEIERDDSDERVVSLQQFVEDLDYAIRWEELNGCQEAAFEDIPARYSYCLSIFARVTPELKNNDSFPTNPKLLLSLLGPTNLNQEWPLPPPLYALSSEDKHSPKSIVAHGLSKVKLSAAVFPSRSNPNPNPNPGLLSSESKFEHPSGPIVLPSTVITSAKEIFGRQVSFYTLRRYNRLATTSILRTAYALGIDIPVIGILICYNRIAIHIDWYEIVHGEFTCNSAFYTTSINSNDETDLNMEMQIWDTDQPNDVHQLTQIFTNIHHYTITHFNTSLLPRNKSAIQQRMADLRLDDDKNIPSPPSTPDVSF